MSLKKSFHGNKIHLLCGICVKDQVDGQPRAFEKDGRSSGGAPGLQAGKTGGTYRGTFERQGGRHTTGSQIVTEKTKQVRCCCVSEVTSRGQAGATDTLVLLGRRRQGAMGSVVN